MKANKTMCAGMLGAMCLAFAAQANQIVSLTPEDTTVPTFSAGLPSPTVGGPLSSGTVQSFVPADPASGSQWTYGAGVRSQSWGSSGSRHLVRQNLMVPLSVAVPDGGLTLALLGIAMGCVGLVSRRLRK